MAKIQMTDTAGKATKTLELRDAVFSIDPNTAVMHRVVVNFLSSIRQGTHDTKGRSEVSGGGKKPWRQKGTDRARQGSIRSPQWKGGGVVFGPTPRTHAKKSNAQEVKLAMRSALSGKLRDKELMVVEKLDFKAPKTKDAVAFLKSHDLLDKRVTIVVPEDAVNVFLSFRNLEKVRVIGTSDANTYNLVDNAALVLTEDAAHYLEEVLA